MLVVRNIIAKALGAFWILDGLLQFQPKMFGADFVNSVLSPNLSGQPFFIHATIAFGIYLWNINTSLANILAALIQIAIGVLLFFPASCKKFKTGLYLSIIWGLIVWIFGEGLGDLFAGSASFYTGAPGSVLIYVLISAFLLWEEKIKLEWFPKIAGWTLILESALQLQAAFWTSDGVQGNIMASSMESLRFLSSFPMYISNLLSINPVLGNSLLALIPLIVGLAIIIKPNRITGTIGLFFLFFVWWLGQDFGMLSTLITGTSTDPNTAPILALFMLPIFFDYKLDFENKNKFNANMGGMQNIKKDSIIKFLVLVIIILLAIIITPYLTAPKPASMGPGAMAPMGMMVKTYNLKPTDPVPTVDFQITEDPVAMGGWDIHITTTNFTWTPQNVNQAVVLDQGHAHLYIDGNLFVVYGPWYHTIDLTKGPHTIVVALAANDHTIFALNGNYIEKEKTIVQN